MIKLKKEEIPGLREMLKKDRRNLFFLNNLELYRLGSEINIYKVDDAYLMNWMDSSICIFSPNGYDCKKILDFLKTQEFNGINGAREYLEPIESGLKDKFSIEYRDFMMIDKSSYKKLQARDVALKELFSPEDYEDLFDLYTTIELFKGDYPPEEKEEWALSKAELEYPTTGVGLYRENKLVSGAYLSGATKASAMVVGVGTRPEHENKGYATQVISELVDIGLNENNIGYLCLWYSDAKARHIYEKIGFRPIGKYAYFSRIAK